MASTSLSSCLFRNPLPWLVALGSFLAFSYSLDFGFLTIFLTSSAVMLYPVIIICSKSSEQDCPNPQDEDCSMNEGSCQNVGGNVAQLKNEEEEVGKERETITSEKKKEVLLSSSETLSDSESYDHTTWSEDSENDYWIFGENLCHSTQFSDGSISDEESLIEIALPEGHYVESSQKQEEKQPSCYGLQKKWSDCSMESHFKQPNWMEMLMEEENLIEIDICMGSIKYSRFEIEA